MLIGYWSNIFTLDWYLIDINPSAFAIWDCWCLRRHQTWDISSINPPQSINCYCADAALCEYISSISPCIIYVHAGVAGSIYNMVNLPEYFNTRSRHTITHPRGFDIVSFKVYGYFYGCCVLYKVLFYWTRACNRAWLYFSVMVSASLAIEICDCKDIICLNTLSPKQNCCHFANDIFRCIFLNEHLHVLFRISLKFVHNGPIDNKPALVQMMAWHRTGDKPLSETMMA